MSECIEEAVLRFEDGKGKTLEKPGRVLLKQGIVARKATFSQVERWCMLFNDCFVFGKPVKDINGQLILKQVIDLGDIEVDNGVRVCFR